MSELPTELDLSRPEDLALFCGMVPDWPDLARDLDLTDEGDQRAFAGRAQRAWDSAVERIKKHSDESS